MRRAKAPGPIVPAAAAVLIALGAIAAARSPGAEEPRHAIALTVDLREAPRRIYHAKLTLPVRRGPLTLLYPKWLPGEHGPTGPVTDLAGPRITAAGKPVEWRRDPAEMTAFRLEVPQGTSEIEIELDFLSSHERKGFTAGASATERLAVLNWNQVLLYPAGVPVESLVFAPRLRVPRGWKVASALDVEAETSEEVIYRPVSLQTLADSPVISGAHHRSVALAPDVAPEHRLEIVADSLAALEMPAETLEAYHRLVREGLALFGAHHYDRYRFLVTLSDHVARFGLEHHQSSDNRSWERAFGDPDRRLLMAGLLPHELVHSWNGKYRRPAGLVTGGFDKPFRTELLWVYEGLTTYLGDVLTARSGLWTPEQYRENLALDAAEMDHRAGRAWRPLADTAAAAQLLFRARDEWKSWRRAADFYSESGLIWLEADALIRERTRGERSLDDFCRVFFGGRSGPARVEPYTYEDLLNALGRVARHDWKTFFEERIQSVAPRAPLGGIEASGWQLVYTETIPQRIRAIEAVHKVTDLTFSLGLVLDEEGKIQDVVPGLPAARAGVAPAMKLLAVNGRRWSKDLLRETIRSSKTSPDPIELLVENGEFLKTLAVDYHGGERYPHLERDPSRPDLLGIRGRTAFEPAGDLP